jgi:YVTN family beta-propeller protein
MALSAAAVPVGMASADPPEVQAGTRSVAVRTQGEAVESLAPPLSWDRLETGAGGFTAFDIDIGRKFASGSAATPDGETVYVMNNDSTISVVDAVNNEFVKTIDFLAHGVGSTSGGVVVDDKLYVVGTSRVVIMDTDTEVVLNTIPQSPGGGVVWGRAVYSPFEKRVYTVCGACSTMLAIDTTNGQLAGSAVIGSENTGISFSASRQRIYISDRIAGELTIVDSQTLSVLDVKPYLSDGGFNAYTTNVAVGLDGRVFVGYVDGSFNFRIAVLDSDGELMDTIVLAGFSTGLDLSRDGLYLVTGDGKIIDTATQAVVSDLPTGIGEFQATMAPDGERAYVTNYNSTFITGIEGFAPLDRLSALRIEMAYELFDPDTLAARVRVADLDQHVFVSGATVEATFDLPDGQVTTSAVSNAQGWARFEVPTAGGGTCRMRVDDISKAGFVFDSNNSRLRSQIACP